MIPSSTTKRHVFKKTASALLLTALVLAPLAIPVRSAHAVALVITQEQPTSPLFIASMTTIAKNNGVAPIDWLDRMAILIARAAVRALTASIVSWINTGFEGNPAFVSDIQGYFRDVADQALGEFIAGTEFAFLCKPFQANIRLALIQQFAKKPKPICRLSSISKNIDQFISGNFYDGGWKSWFVLTTDPYGNEYSSFVNSSLQVQARILTAQGTKKAELDFGRGFLSLSECRDVYESGEVDVSYGTTVAGESIGNTASGLNRTCSIVTPGTAIENQLTNVVGSDLRQLELASSFNQILDALMGQLIKQVLLGAGGLAGVSKPTSSTGSSFIQSYGAASNQTGISNSKQDMTDAIAGGLKNENEYKKLKGEMLASVTVTGSLLGSLAACYTEKLLPQSGIYGEQRTVAQGRLAQASSTIAEKIAPSKKEFGDQIRSAELNIILLSSLQDDIARVKSEFDLLTPGKELAKLQSSGRMHGEYSVADARQQRDALVAEMDALAETTKKDIDACKVYPNQPTTP